MESRGDLTLLSTRKRQRLSRLDASKERRYREIVAGVAPAQPPRPGTQAHAVAAVFAKAAAAARRKALLRAAAKRLGIHREKLGTISPGTPLGTVGTSLSQQQFRLEDPKPPCARKGETLERQV